MPLVGALAGPLLAGLVLEFDGHVTMPASWAYSESTASTILGSIASALVALTGFVVAFGVLVVQMATQTLSPRFMRLWYRDGLQKAVLATFVATLTYSLALLRGVDDTSVPDVGVTLAGIGVTVCVVLFLVYLDRFVHNLRPVAVAWNVAAAGARVFLEDESHPSATATTPPDGAPTLLVRCASPGAIQAIDREGLLATAIRHDCVLVLPNAVGDIVAHHTVLVEVHGATPPRPNDLRGMLALGEERTIEQDPAFALRILVDIAIRALSPAVNDPNTACQVMGGIEDLLLVIGESDLSGRGQLRDGEGRLRVLIRTRSWDDVLALALTEIREYGATSTQVTRRMRTLLDRLAERVRPEHRAAVDAQISELDAALERHVPDPRAREFASRPDAQGLGGPSQPPISSNGHRITSASQG